MVVLKLLRVLEQFHIRAVGTDNIFLADQVFCIGLARLQKRQRRLDADSLPVTRVGKRNRLIELLTGIRILMKAFALSGTFEPACHHRPCGRVVAGSLVGLVEQITAPTDDQPANPCRVRIARTQQPGLVDHAARREHAVVMGAYRLVPADEREHAQAAHREHDTKDCTGNGACARLLPPFLLLTERRHVFRWDAEQGRNDLELFRVQPGNPGDA